MQEMISMLNKLFTAPSPESGSTSSSKGSASGYQVSPIHEPHLTPLEVFKDEVSVVP